MQAQVNTACLQVSKLRLVICQLCLQTLHLHLQQVLFANNDFHILQGTLLQATQKPSAL